MFVNNIPLDHLQGRLLQYTVGPPVLNNETFQAKNTLFPRLFSSADTARTLTVSIVFQGESRKQVTQKLSYFYSLIKGKSELSLPDGFFYTCILQEVSNPQETLPTLFTVEYQFLAVRHGPMRTIEIQDSCEIFCDGHRDTDVIFTIRTTGALTIQGITIQNMTGPVVLDGIQKTVTQNGVNKFADTNLLSFPRLTPGLNSILLSKPAGVTIQYYPAYY